MGFKRVAFLIAAVAFPLVASAADLQVSVTGGPSAPATLYAALFNSAEAMSSNRSLASQKVEMREGTAQFVFTDLPPGRYVIRSFADEDGDGKLNTNIVGMPTERYGFSKNAKGRMGPPTFEAAAFELDADSHIGFELR